jgi:signal transduction histidine kinase
LRDDAHLLSRIIIMDQQETSQLDRLIALVAEAEAILAKSIASHDIRHGCAVARGYLDLARSYGEPVNIEDVERVIARMRTTLRPKTKKRGKTARPEWIDDCSVA